jgi:dTDP-4-amino-4,6-dideoxygalactose transaminase
MSHIPISRPFTGPEEAAAAAAVLASGWLGMGPAVAALEARFSTLLESPGALLVSSGTTALELAMEALGVGPGDEVITVSLSFIATANSVRRVGAVPVFVDVEARGLNLDVDRVEEALTPRTRAVLCVHQVGMPCNVRRLAELCRRRGLLLIEDTACALGSWLDEPGGAIPLGHPIGDASCLSFHPRKVITCGEGGLLTSPHPEVLRRAAVLRNQGMETGPAGLGFPLVGHNFRMTDLQAAVLGVQLDRLSDFVQQRRAQARLYHDLLTAALPQLELPQEPAGTRSNWQSYCVMLPPGVPQAQVLTALEARGVSCRASVGLAHTQPAYADLPLRHPLPNSEDRHRRSLLLPIYPGLTQAQQFQVVEALAQTLSLTGAPR